MKDGVQVVIKLLSNLCFSEPGVQQIMPQLWCTGVSTSPKKLLEIMSQETKTFKMIRQVPGRGIFQFIWRHLCYSQVKQMPFSNMLSLTQCSFLSMIRDGSTLIATQTVSRIRDYVNTLSV